jgi:branched-subunit amino acid aminotransferase/4-amino-4-deoxychorismate lyase
VLDGVLRRELIEHGKCVEAVVMADDLSGEAFLGNSLRGLIPAEPSHTSVLARGA